MTYLAKEESVYEGDVQEFFLFVQGATSYRWTSADETVSVADPSTPHDYAPAMITRDQVQYSDEDHAGSLRIGVPDSNPVAQLWQSYTPPTPVFLTVRRKHRSDAEVVIHWVGKVTSVTFTDQGATLNCAPISQSFMQTAPGLLYQSQCVWDLYGTGCGVTAASFKDAATLDTVDGVTLTDTVFDARPDGYYTNGWVERANGERRFVVDHVGDTITLMNAFPASLTAGETVDAYAGCDRTEATCAATFSNLVNHLGFPRIPSRNPHSGEAID